jgi:hypothetical protein
MIIMARKNAIIASEVSDDATAVTFSVAGFDPIVVNVAALSADLVAYAAAHGIKQKVADAGALGANSTPADKYAAMKAVADRLAGGEWDKARGDGSGAVAGLIYRAFAQWAVDMAKLSGSAAPADTAIRAHYDGMDRKAQLALRNVPEIAAIMETLRAAKAPKTAPDPSAMLAALGIGKPAKG